MVLILPTSAETKTETKPNFSTLLPSQLFVRCSNDNPTIKTTATTTAERSARSMTSRPRRRGGGGKWKGRERERVGEMKGWRKDVEGEGVGRTGKRDERMGKGRGVGGGGGGENG